MNNNNPLGFVWDFENNNNVILRSTASVLGIYKQQLPAFVWDAAKLENNPFTFIEVKTLLDGVTVGGHKVSDAEQVTNLADSSKKLIELVSAGNFDLNKKTITLLHHIVARNEALEWGVFRGEGDEKYHTPHVSLGEYGAHIPFATCAGAEELNKLFNEGTTYIKTLPPLEGGLLMFLFCALHQFFFDGNKRVGRHMMNGHLMSNGLPPISIPAKKAQEFNEGMVKFYISKNGTEMLTFLQSCS